MQASTVSGLLTVLSIGRASDFHLAILHQNDIHARYEPVDNFGIVCRGRDFQIHNICLGGFARAVEYVKRVKSRPYSTNVLVVNTGDFFHGEIMHMVFKWEVAAKLAKLMPYDALALGNKEFQDGVDDLLSFMRAIGSKVFVCTNIDFSASNATLREELQQLCPRHRILTFSEKKVGIVSYLKPGTMELKKISHIHVQDEVEALTREIGILRQKGVKLFVALGHAGYERDQEVARRVPSLDVVVGGHSHTLLWPDIVSDQEPGIPPYPMDADSAQGPYPTVVVQPNGRRVLVVQGFFAGRLVGNINVTFNADDEVKDWWPQPELLQKSMPEDNETKSALADLRRRLENATARPVGRSLVQLVGLRETCHQQECNLANLLADAFLWALRTYAGDAPFLLPTIALVNAGIIRNRLPMGEVPLQDLVDAMPFRNAVDVIMVNGSALQAALELGASTVDQLHGRFMQVSGARFALNLNEPPGRRVSQVELLCAECPVPRYEPLQPAKHYRLATSTYIANGGDGFAMLAQPLERQRFGILDVQLMVDYIGIMSPVHPYVEDRIRLTAADKSAAKPNATGSQAGPQVGPGTVPVAAALMLCAAALLHLSSV